MESQLEASQQERRDEKGVKGAIRDAVLYLYDSILIAHWYPFVQVDTACPLAEKRWLSSHKRERRERSH